MLILLFASFLAVGYSGSGYPQAGEPGGNSTNVIWLGTLPTDEYYSTRKLSFVGTQGIVVTEDTVLGSDDGGLSWTVRAKGSEVPQSIADAWLASSSQLFALSGGSLFESSSSGSAWKQIDIGQRGVRYLGIAGDRASRHIVLVGERSVAITRTQMAKLPKYAHDLSTTPPSMVVPAISTSNDEGVTWRAIELPKAIGYLHGVEMSGALGVAWGPYAVYASTDGGLSWKLMNIHLPDEEEEEAYPVSAAIAGERLQVSLKNGRILTGSIAGHILSTVAHLPNPLGHLSFFDQCTGFGITSEAVPNAGREDVLVKTEDGGITWNSVLHSKKIVSLSSGTTDLYGATADHAFRINVPAGRNAHSCAR